MAQHSTQTKVTSICVQNVLSSFSWESEDRGMYRWRPENTEGGQTPHVAHKWDVFASQGH